jgi:ankyrin repeat protein
MFGIILSHIRNAHVSPEDIRDLTEQLVTAESPEAVDMFLKVLSEDQRKWAARYIVVTAAKAGNGRIIIPAIPYVQDWPWLMLWGIKGGSLEAVQALLTVLHGSAEWIHSQSDLGTPLRSASENSTTARLLNSLLSVPENDTDLGEDNGHTPFVIACRLRNIPIMITIAELCGPQLELDSEQVNDGFVTAFRLHELHDSGDSAVSRGRRHHARPNEDESICHWGPSPNRLGVQVQRVSLITDSWSPELIHYFSRFSCVELSRGFGRRFLLSIAHNEKLLQAALTIPQIDPNVSDKGGMTTMMHSIRYKNQEAVKLLLSHPRIKVNQRSHSGDTAFTIASGTDQIDILRLLMSHLKFNLEQSQVNRAFFQAILSNAIQSAEFLLSLDFDINKEIAIPPHERHSLLEKYSQFARSTCYSTVLAVATLQGNTALLESVVQHPRFDVSKGNYETVGFASLASDVPGVLEIVMRLIGKQVNWRNANDESILTVAIARNKVEMIESILKCPHFELTKEDAVMLLWFSIRNQKHIISQTSSDRPIYVQHCGSEYSRRIKVKAEVPPAVASAKIRNFAIFETILDIPSFNLNLTDSNENPLLFALLDDVTLLERFLKEDGRYDINIRDSHGDTAMTHCVKGVLRKELKSKSIKLLVGKGIDLTAQDKSGRTAWELMHCMRGMSLIPPQPEDREEYIKQILKARK